MVTVTGRILPPPLLQYGGKTGGMIPVSERASEGEREGGREGGREGASEGEREGGEEINCFDCSLYTANPNPGTARQRCVYCVTY